MKKITTTKKFLVTWDEYHSCSAIVEAESEEGAEGKWCDDEYTGLRDDVQNIDNVEVCEQ